jgi:hypothetical protein
MPLEDKHANKLVRSALVKRGVDISYLDVRISSGIVYLRGPINFVPGRIPIDPKSEVANLIRVLRHQPNVRDVVAEVTYK